MESKKPLINIINKTVQPWKHAHLPPLPISSHRQEEVPVHVVSTHIHKRLWMVVRIHNKLPYYQPFETHGPTLWKKTSPLCSCREIFSSLRTLSIFQDIFLSWTTKHFVHQKLKTKWLFLFFCFGFACLPRPSPPQNSSAVWTETSECFTNQN